MTKSVKYCKGGGKPSLAILGSRGIPAKYGGFETFAEEISLRLANRRVEVTVYCETELNKQDASFMGVKLVYLPAPRLGPLSTILFDIVCLWHARNKYDIVYMLGYGAAPFCFLPRLFGTTVWLNVDGIEWARAKWGWIAKSYFKLMEIFSLWTPDRIIADAEGIRLHLESRHWRMPPCSVIPYGAEIVKEADVSLLEEWELSAGKYYLIVCRLEPENHILEIIKGFLASPSNNVLIIVGSYSSGNNYVTSLLGFRFDRVIFIGTVYDSIKIKALRYYSLAYFHGHSVGGTNPSLLEAMGCGNIIIAHDNVYNREVAMNIGYFFKDDVGIPDIINEIESLSNSDISALKHQAQQVVSDKYNWETITSMYLKLLGYKGI